METPQPAALLPERARLILRSASTASPTGVTVAGHPLGLAVVGMHYAYLNTVGEYLLFTSAEIPTEELGEEWQLVYLPPPVRPAAEHAAAAPPERPQEARKVSRGPVISEAQVQRLWAISRNEGGYTKDGVHRLLAEYDRAVGGELSPIASAAEVGRDVYDEIILRLRSREEGSRYSRDPYTQNMFQ